jgi:N-acetylneuraminic acid mutarotase
MWVMGGFGNGLKNDVWYSSDGETWTQATSSASWSVRKGHTSVVYNNKIWVIGGLDGNDVWYSSDGISWTQATSSASWSSLSYHTSVVYDNKMCVIGGLDGSNLKNDVGIAVMRNWTQATLCFWSVVIIIPVSSMIITFGSSWIDGMYKNDVG